MNLHAVRAIYLFEMARTRRTLLQSVLAPVISTSLYFVVFGSAIGARIPEVGGAVDPGSEAHDEIFWSEQDGFFRETNHAGGLEGGMTNGQPLSVRAAIKPISTLTKPLRSVDIETHEPAQALRERTDSCTVPAAAVVAEAMVALVLADGYKEKLGGDHIDDAIAALRAYEERIGWRR
mgnify:CR=1 FL=1